MKNKMILIINSNKTIRDNNPKKVSVFKYNNIILKKDNSKNNIDLSNDFNTME